MESASPYVGLRYYETDDQHRFYGRDREAQEARALWLSNRLLIVYGQSGVGKTSLLRAGVVPRISQRDANLLPVSRIPQGSAFPAAVVPHHNPYSFALLSAWSREEPPTLAAGMRVAEFLRGLPEVMDRYDTPLPLLVAIDQFEELFSDLPHRRVYREEFVEQLVEAVEALPRLRLLIAIREDFVAKLLPYEATLGQHGRARFPVGLLGSQAALEAVTRPLASTARFFAPGVAEKLVDNLRTTVISNSLGEIGETVTDTVEPVHLQVVCSALWEALPEPVREISLGHLRDHGNIERALTDFCARTVAEVSARHGVPEPDVWEWLIREFVTEMGTRGTVYEGISTAGGMPNEVARALEERHILKAERRAGSHWFELLHDRLIDPIRRGNRPWSAQTVPNPSPAVYLRTAEGALADGDLELAEKYAGESIVFGGDRADPRTRAEAEAFLGGLAAQRGHLSDARARYASAAMLFDTLGDQIAVGRVQATIGRLLSTAGRNADALVELLAASAKLPGDVELRVDLARVYTRVGQHQAALGVLGGALTIAPADVGALLLRGWIEATHGDPASALKDLENAARLRPALGDDGEVGAALQAARARLDAS
ncbi:hypothetical protein [Frankia sp. AgKG'84/4]|uniref:nSTAND1 domain-containing NTPase n=1 Tax=Frankia sp. AgKG'84/4 TaxID=573490 RepID=UPI00202A5762|nr:hypothetical protein [Frankia sp. AgKG'84/4]MCL9793420.1 hypothetical protein [Frankia sp. AgKG'84/4]